MTTRHTPGPWAADNGIIRRADGCGIAIMTNVQSDDELGPEREADARLIAAAPELLEALKRVSGFSVTPDDINSARDAIAKAEGGAE